MTEYTKVVMLDADMLCTQNMDELFDLDLPSSDNIALPDGVAPGPGIGANQ
jgi:alpha-N-acetylglucosamine transferase